MSFYNKKDVFLILLYLSTLNADSIDKDNFYYYDRNVNSLD